MEVFFVGVSVELVAWVELESYWVELASF